MVASKCTVVCGEARRKVLLWIFTCTRHSKWKKITEQKRSKVSASQLQV